MATQTSRKYRLRDDYRRFDQKNEMFCRSIWDTEFAETLTVPNYAKAIINKALEQVKAGHEGFALREMSLCWASWTIASMENAGPGWRGGNRGLFSWKPLGASTASHSGTPLWRIAGVDAGNVDDVVTVTRSIKKIGRAFGATEIGVAGLDRRWVYSNWWSRYTHEGGEIRFSDEMGDPEVYMEPSELADGTRVIPASMMNVIVLGFERGYEAIDTSPDSVAGCETGMGYSKMAFTTPTLAEYIRNLGYNAIPMGNDTALSVPMAIEAGLGQLGRNGLLVNPKHGSRLALSKILTDMPLVHDSPVEFGLTEFCDVCKKCAKHCPSQAISYEERSIEGQTFSNNPGSLKWFLHPERCMRFWTDLGEDCSNCLRSCAFNKPPGVLHDIVRWIIASTTVFNRLFVWLDDLLGYGKKKSSSSFFGY
jgi:reductive dehalogenase